MILLKCLIFFICVNLSCISGEKITLKNHEKISEGEWLVKFYADWCGSCQNFAPIWDQLSIMDYQDSAVRFGEVNIEREPHLSVKYSVRYLPSIYHIKDGVVRLYEGKREVSEIEDFINHKKYLQVKPLPWYNNPNGVLIAFLLKFVSAYEYFLEFQNDLVEKYGFTGKVAAAISYAVASLVLVLCSFMCALSFIPLINFFLPKQPSDFTEVAKKQPKEISSAEDEEEDTSKSGIEAKPDLRERKRAQQKKRASRE